MQDLIRIKMSALIVSVALMLSGCVLWPKLQPDQDLKLRPPGETVNPRFPCLTAEYSVARECAELTVIEISDLLESTGDFDRGAAYAALGLATATGSVIAFTGGSTALKGLAIASGTLLGLNSFVNTEQQRSILKKGLEDMLCYISVADSVHQLALNNVNRARPSTNTEDAFKPENFSIDKNNMNIYEVIYLTKQITSYEKLHINLNRLYNSIGSEQDIGRQLSTAVIEKRAELRASLASLTPKVDTVLKEQRNRIVDMAGQIIAARAAIKKQSEEPGLVNVASTEEHNFVARIHTLKEDSFNALTETSAVSSIFAKCVDSATNEALNQ